MKKLTMEIIALLVEGTFNIEPKVFDDVRGFYLFGEDVVFRCKYDNIYKPQVGAGISIINTSLGIDGGFRWNMP